MLDRKIIDLSIISNGLDVGFKNLGYKTLFKLKNKNSFSDIKSLLLVVKKTDISGIIGEVSNLESKCIINIEEFLSVVNLYRPKFFIMFYNMKDEETKQNIDCDRYNIKHIMLKKIDVFIGLRKDFPFYEELLDIKLGEVKIGKNIDIEKLSTKVAEKITLYFMGLDFSESSKTLFDIISKDSGGWPIC